MEKLLLLQRYHNTHQHCYRCRSCLTQPKFKDNELAGRIFTNLTPEEEQMLEGRKVAKMYCNNCCNLFRAKAAEAAYYDEKSKKRDLVIQLLLKRKAIPSLCKAFSRDFIIEPLFTESAAERVGLELYTLVNGPK